MPHPESCASLGAMALRVEPMTVRERPAQLMDALFADGWPAFSTADQVVARHIARVREWFADLELVLLDGEVPVAAGWGVPMCWDGRPAALPGGYTSAMVTSVTEREDGAAPNTLVIMAGQVHPAMRGRGLARDLVNALRQLATDRGWRHVLAPLRPGAKSRYPLTPIEQYARWTRPDGAPFDPWLRSHTRMGARLLGTVPASQTMTGTVGQWETWTGMALPASGSYVIPNGLAPLHVDRERDIGVYVEPGIWVQHRC